MESKESGGGGVGRLESSMRKATPLLPGPGQEKKGCLLPHGSISVQRKARQRCGNAVEGLETKQRPGDKAGFRENQRRKGEAGTRRMHDAPKGAPRHAGTLR